MYSVIEDQILNLIGLNVLFMTQKGATSIYAASSYLVFIDLLLQSGQILLPHICFHQAHYDAVQQKKKGSSRQASLKSGNLAMTVEEEEEEPATEEEGMLSGKRRHFTMPESVV